jgi:two-component system chemotaxis sensor kinase CheA
MDTAVDLSAFLPDFLAEVQEHLEALTQGLLDLEGRPDDGQLVKDLFRSAHTIKGTARMIGYTAVAQVAHAAENVLDGLREHRLAVNAEVVDALLGAVDAMKQLLAREGAQPEAAPAEVLRRLENVMGTSRPTGELLPAPSPPDRGGEGGGDVLRPPLGPGEAISAPAPAEADETIRVSVARLDTLLKQIGDLTALKTGWESDLLELRALAQMAGEQRRLTESALKIVESLPASAASTQLKAQALRLRDHQSRLITRLHTAALKTTDRLEVLSTIADRLHDDVMELRLLPLATILGPLSRTIRDLAREEGKQVAVSVTGGEVELDRHILQEISEPLLHLVRNAVSHGIELPQNRVAQGKSPLGQISLRSARQGDRVIIEIADDGRGMDPDLVRQVAVGRGLISAEQAARLDDRAALELIYTPGFSTSPFITEASGRGVGMSAVKAAVRRLGGTIHIASRVGAGTTFTLSLPLTLSLSHVLLVSAGGQIVALPAADVRAIRLPPWTTDGGRQTTDDGQVVEVVSLAQVLALPPSDPPHMRRERGLGRRRASGGRSAVRVRNGQSQAIFTVDALLDERRVAIKPVGRVLRGACEFISGATVLADGAIAFLLDTAALVSAVKQQAWTPPRNQGQFGMEDTGRRARILVVDDMVTTRELERSILTAAGYQVEVAGNGAQALALLRGGAFDLVVTDIEMPVMDGLALVVTLREHPQWAHLPVVLVTSLNQQAAEQRAREVGAQAALEKSTFTQDILLDTVARLIHDRGQGHP